MFLTFHCSPSQTPTKWTSDRVHCGQSTFAEYGVHVCYRMHIVCADVAEEETQRNERPTGERLCGPGQTPQCGEMILFSCCPSDDAVGKAGMPSLH